MMITMKHWSLVAIAATVACAGELSAAPATKAQSQKAAVADPLGSFKAVMTACTAQLDGWPRESVKPAKSGSEWVHTFLEIVSVAHDVKRTDSLVSPFTAYIKIDTLEHVVRRPTEGEARAAEKHDGAAIKGTDEIRYAFQDARWKLVGGSTQRAMKRAGESAFSDPLGTVQLDVDSFERNPRWVGCIP